MSLAAKEDEEEWFLAWQQIAQARKRFQAMLKTSDSDWAKMGFEGGAAPWTQGDCIAKEVQLKANLFLRCEGSVQKILETLKRAKFPMVAEASSS